jgi:hypothetical protein
MPFTVDRSAALTLNAGNGVAFTTDFAAAAPAAPAAPTITPANAWIPVGAIDQTGLTESFASTTVNVMALGILSPYRVLYTDQTRTFQIVMLETERDICQSVMFQTPLASLARVPNAAPGLTSATGAITGGALVANTYYYKITGTTGSGETTGSVEQSGTVASGTAGTMTLVWPTVPTGTTGIKVYRGTATNAENVLVATLSSVTSPYVDLGGTTTAATVPTVSTAGLRTVVETSTPIPDRRGWLFRIADGAVIQQFYIPQGEVTTRANVAYPQNDVAKFDITLTTYPDAAGNTCYRLDNAPVTPLQSNS